MTISWHDVPVGKLYVFGWRSHFIRLDEVAIHHYLLDDGPIFSRLSRLVPPVRVNEVFPDPDKADKDYDDITEESCCENPTIGRLQRFFGMIACEAYNYSWNDQVHYKSNDSVDIVTNLVPAVVLGRIKRDVVEVESHKCLDCY